MGGPLSRWLKIPTLSERLRAQGVREDLIQAADRTAFGRQTDAGIPAAGELLRNDEAVLVLVEGRYTGAMGLLLLTSRRLLFVPARSDRSTSTSVPLSRIEHVSARTHRGMGVLDVTVGDAPAGSGASGAHGAGGVADAAGSVGGGAGSPGAAAGSGRADAASVPGGLVVDQILGNQAETLAAAIETAIAAPPDGPAGHRDPLEELAELRALHRAGVIEDAEFQIRKQQLFGQI
jgi:hypothetical protein